MSDDVDGFIATAPALRFAFAIRARVGPAEPSLKWLERATFVGVAARTPDRVAIGFHEVP
jgi:hypothetical protein